MIYFVRHGQTQLGAEGRFQGCKEDCSLSELGEEQARRLQKGLPAFVPIFVSPMKRAQETAFLAAPTATKMLLEELRDVDVGPLGGKTREEVKSLFPEFYWRWLNHKVYVLPDGEQPASILSRAERALALLPVALDSIVVSHEGIIRFLLCKLLGLSWDFFPKLKIDEASISLVADGQLIRLNDTSHLREL